MDSVEIVISPEHLKALTGPGVYLFKAGETILYVGATRNGLGRCLSSGHKMFRLPSSPRDRLSRMSLTFRPTESEASAYTEEERLIKEFQPVYNLTQADGYNRRRARRRAEKLEWKRKEREKDREFRETFFRTSHA